MKVMCAQESGKSATFNSVYDTLRSLLDKDYATKIVKIDGVTRPAPAWTGIAVIQLDSVKMETIEIKKERNPVEPYAFNLSRIKNMAVKAAAARQRQS
jgi:hypothetical protein